MPDARLYTGPVDDPGRYAVDADELAAAMQGGEGLVYRAIDTASGDAVALKLLTGVTLADFARIVERSRSMEEFAHPNVMRQLTAFTGTALVSDPHSIDDVNEFDVVYTVAEWVEGANLSSLTETVDVSDLLGHVASIARGLHALHTFRSQHAPQGIVHRDVKPSNIRVTPDGRAVLVDFGAARPLDDDLTTGTGTYRWRAPEVLSGSAQIGGAADVWSLGAVAHWIVAGEPPGLEGSAVCRERMLHAPSVKSLTNAVGTVAHIAQLLETDPSRRPADLDRWADQLRALMRRRARGGVVAPRRVAMLAVPGTLAAAGIVIAALALGDAGEQPASAAVSSSVADAATNVGPVEYRFADGSRVALLVQGLPQVTGGSAVTLLANNEVATSWTYSDDDSVMTVRRNCLDDAYNQVDLDELSDGPLGSEVRWRVLLEPVAGGGAVGAGELVVSGRFVSMRTDHAQCEVNPVGPGHDFPLALDVSAWLVRAAATAEITIPSGIPAGLWAVVLLDGSGGRAEVGAPLILQIG